MAKIKISSILLFVLIIAIFCWCISSVSSGQSKRQKENLENSIMRSIANCYALEGSYPESLDYIKENYGLVYDEDKFYVDYRASGSNMMPGVTIIEIKE
ncbi:MAG: hypothetical protein PUB09_03945 [Firmicutes bacterium]|nr:hypothetical protein [Bacillota bacterium]